MSDLTIQTPHGKVSIKFCISCFEIVEPPTRCTVEITAPFLLMPLRLETEYLPLVLDRLAAGTDELFLEFLDRLELSKDKVVLLECLKDMNLTYLLQHLRENQKDIEVFRRMAWSLKKKGFALENLPRSLLVLGWRGMNRIYDIKFDQRIISFCRTQEIHPHMVYTAIKLYRPCNDWFKDQYFKHNLRLALKQLPEEIVANVVGTLLSA